MMAVATAERLRFLWLEITGRCQLRCRHCYSESGPDKGHDSMMTGDWRRVLDEAADIGVSDVQFIGGEPTLHPDLAKLIQHALGRGLAVEVYSNLVRVTDSLWAVFERPGVRLATSYYSPDAAQHDAITDRHSHDRTLANAREALRRGIPLRVGLVDVDDGQDVAGAVAELESLGVTSVSVDRLRQVGRGVRNQTPSVEQLCGKCADGTLAVTPSGDVLPCVFARWLVLGNVRDAALREVNESAAQTRRELRSRFVLRAACDPKCDPRCQPCPPNGDGQIPGCPPMDPVR
jgi:radical SAM protein with 4Fe4S-binding SPASM domain